MKKNPRLIHVAMDDANGEPIDFDTNLAELKDYANSSGMPPCRIDTFTLLRTSWRPTTRSRKKVAANRAGR